MTHGKRILKVVIKRMYDEDPDTSYLGEYSQRQSSRFSIDRDHREDCASSEANSGATVNQLERVIGHVQEWRRECEGDANNTDWEALDDALDTLARAQADAQECDCGGDHCGRGEYRYFNPSSNYVTSSGEPTDGLTEEEVYKHTRQDYERMESLNAGHWCYIGLRAEAKIGIGDVVNYPARYNVTTQTITSGGLWGIESDSESGYFEEVKAEQLAELKDQLKALGFSARAIATAFKNAEEVNE